MMNKKRTKRIAKAKYALYIPLAAALLVVSNIETVARVIANVAKAMPMAKASVKQEKMVDLSFSNKATVAVESRKNVQSTEAIERKDNKMEVQVGKRRVCRKGTKEKPEECVRSHRRYAYLQWKP